MKDNTIRAIAFSVFTLVGLPSVSFASMPSYSSLDAITTPQINKENSGVVSGGNNNGSGSGNQNKGDKSGNTGSNNSGESGNWGNKK